MSSSPTTFKTAFEYLRRIGFAYVSQRLPVFSPEVALCTEQVGVIKYSVIRYHTVLDGDQHAGTFEVACERQSRPMNAGQGSKYATAAWVAKSENLENPLSDKTQSK